jgi:hypothetical protein
MSIADRLDLIELALELIRRDLAHDRQSDAAAAGPQRLAEAAASLRDDYATNGELTTFTVLDAEDFLAPG